MSQQEKTENQLPSLSFPQSFNPLRANQPQQANPAQIETKPKWWDQLSKKSKCICISSTITTVILVLGAIFAIAYFATRSTITLQKEKTVLETFDKGIIKDFNFEVNWKWSILSKSEIVRGKFVVAENRYPDNSTYKEKYLVITDAPNGITVKSFNKGNLRVEADLDQMLINFEKNFPVQSKRLLAQAALLADDQGAARSEYDKDVADALFKAVSSAIQTVSKPIQPSSTKISVTSIDYYQLDKRQSDGVQSTGKKSSRLLYMLSGRNLRIKWKPQNIINVIGITNPIIIPITTVTGLINPQKGPVGNPGSIQQNSGNTNWTNIINNITNMNITNIVQSSVVNNYRVLHSNSANQVQPQENTNKKSMKGQRRLKEQENAPQPIPQSNKPSLSPTTIKCAIQCVDNYEGNRQCPLELVNQCQSTSSKKNPQYSRSLYVIQVVTDPESINKDKI